MDLFRYFVVLDHFLDIGGHFQSASSNGFHAIFDCVLVGMPVWWRLAGKSREYFLCNTSNKYRSIDQYLWVYLGSRLGDRNRHLDFLRDRFSHATRFTLAAKQDVTN